MRASMTFRRTTPVGGEPHDRRPVGVVGDVKHWDLNASFAGVALLLAVIGIYGVISYGVTQRGREIGIRLALGAQRHDIVPLALRQGLMLTAAGTALGLAGSLLLSRLLRDLLFGVTTTDASTFVVVCAVLAATAALARYHPSAPRGARRSAFDDARGVGERGSERSAMQ